MNRQTDRVLCLVLATICGISAGQAFAVPTAFQPNYDLGYDHGYSVGYDSGFANGEARGQGEGTAAGEEAGYQTGWDDAYQPAYDLAYAAQLPLGMQQGYIDGFPTGFVNGYDWAPTLLSMINSDYLSSGDWSLNRPPSGTHTSCVILSSDSWLSVEMLSPSYDWAAHYFDVGYADGHAVGYPVGSQDGYDFAYPVAYAAAFDIAYPQGLDEGTTEGTLVGGQAGFDNGWDTGFDTGHSDGFYAGLQYHLFGYFDTPDVVANSALAGATVPEPATLSLAGMVAIVGLMRFARRRSRLV